MLKTGVCFFAICFFVCCNNAGSKQADKSESAVDSTTINKNAPTGNNTTDTTACYSYMQNGDTVLLSIAASGRIFSGHLLYHLKEKDRNNGAVAGSIKGDTLIADYTFSSEGTQSVRQVAFLRQGNNLKEGFGEVKETGGKMVFTNPAQLSFSGFSLMSTACR